MPFLSALKTPLRDGDLKRPDEFSPLLKQNKAQALPKAGVS